MSAVLRLNMSAVSVHFYSAFKSLCCFWSRVSLCKSNHSSETANCKKIQLKPLLFWDCDLFQKSPSFNICPQDRYRGAGLLGALSVSSLKWMHWGMGSRWRFWRTGVVSDPCVGEQTGQQSSECVGVYRLFWMENLRGNRWVWRWFFRYSSFLPLSKNMQVIEFI